MTPKSPDESRVLAALEESVPGRVAASVSAILDRACGDACAVAWWHQARDTWLSVPPAPRARAIGIATLAAVVTHVSLQWPQRTVGYWWLIIPGIAAAFALLALAAASMGDRRVR